MSMLSCNCSCRCSCAIAAVVASVIVGVVTAFLQIAAVITVAPAFLWAAFGIAVGYLGIGAVTASLSCRCRRGGCLCAGLDVALIGSLGTALLAIVLLAVGITATSIVSAILVGLLLLFLSLLLTGTACYVRTMTDCAE